VVGVGGEALGFSSEPVVLGGENTFDPAAQKRSEDLGGDPAEFKVKRVTRTS
jgi:hypothetical protein